MFKKIFLVALVLCVCYFGAISARPQIPGLDVVQGTVGNVGGGAAGGAVSGLVGGAAGTLPGAVTGAVGGVPVVGGLVGRSQGLLGK